MRRLLTLAVGGLLVLAASCRSVSPPGVSISTHPPGARVVIDGADSGFVTPCNLDLDDGSVTQVTLELPGYVSAVRLLADDSQSWYVAWGHGNVGVRTWRFPLWLRFQDLFMPIERSSGKMPRRVFVRLRPTNDA